MAVNVSDFTGRCLFIFWDEIFTLNTIILSIDFLNSGQAFIG